MTIASHLLNTTFPFHTEPEYEITGGFVDGMGGIMSVAFAPFVTPSQKEEWEQYAWDHQDWVENSHYLKKIHPVHRDALHGTIQDHEHDRRRVLQDAPEEEPLERIHKEIFKWVEYENGLYRKVPEVVTGEHDQMFAPFWQVSPADYTPVNVNLLSDQRVKDLVDVMERIDYRHAILSSNTEVGILWDFLFDPEEKPQKKLPHGFIMMPVYKEFVDEEIIQAGQAKDKIVGFLLGITVYSNLLDRLLPEGTDGIIGVIKDDCGNTMSFELSDSKADFLGYEDIHETEFNAYEHMESNLEMYESTVDGLCQHDLYIYPSSKFRDTFDSNYPYIYSAVVAMAFLVTAVLLGVYDWMVNQRQAKTMRHAARTQALVSSLFPKAIGQKLVEEATADDTASKTSNSEFSAWKKSNNKAGLQNFLGQDNQSSYMSSGVKSKPLAELFPAVSTSLSPLH